MKKFLAKQSWKSIVTVWVLALGLVTGIQLVKENLDNRSNADELMKNSVSETEVDETGGVCGDADGGFGVSSRPVTGLCNSGSAIWTDSVANDGTYNWYCTNDDGDSDECYAFIDK